MDDRHDPDRLARGVVARLELVAQCGNPPPEGGYVARLETQAKSQRADRRVLPLGDRQLAGIGDCRATTARLGFFHDPPVDRRDVVAAQHHQVRLRGRA